MSWIDQHPDMAGAFDAVSSATCVDSKLFREAMSRLGAAVHVITTDGPAGKTGFTATAVCSVSDTPSTLLVCLNRGSNSSPILRTNGVFCVNTLRFGDEIVADTFAGRTKVSREARFETGEWKTLVTGAPALMSAVVAFDCHISEVKAVASHDIIFGVVQAIHSGPPGAALVYHDRAYKQV
jgi:flavin reductase (DIM6/NTAB) family NADH-FMN oxidoreductase RutF